VENRKISLNDGIRLALLRKRTILVLVLAGGVLGSILGFVIPPTYTARASFLPPSASTSSSSTMMGQLSQLGSLGGMGSALGAIKDPTAINIGILQSRTVADDMIQQFHLQDVYHMPRLSDAEKKLARNTKFIPGKDTQVTVSVEDHDPNRAAAMANAYLQALGKQNNRLALTEAAERRTFFEHQLDKEKDLLAKAEVDLATTEQQTGIIQPASQAQAQIASITQTQAAIASHEIELAALSQGATSQNPEVIRVNSELASLRDQLDRLESSKSASRGNPLPSTARDPELMLDYVRRDREVKYHEALYELLLRQYESARLDESRSAPFVQVVDQAIAPDTKSGPSHALLILGSAFLGGLLGIAWVVATLFREEVLAAVRA
jgi:tyrosine-protein kinase Etk/Wzc